jgi:CubicO group peptidase (beta-lactamase class C family)
MIKNFCALTLALAVAFCPNLNRAQATNDRFPKQLQPIIEQVMQQANIPGLAIAIVQNREVVYAQGFGVKNLAYKSEKVTPQSLFHMASITMPFVATSVMQLAEKDKVDLDKPVVKYLPYFRMQDDRYAAITVRQMLSHISGMPDVRDYEWDKPQYDDGTLERYVRSLSNMSLFAAPGTKWQYSNMAYEVLGDLISKVSGETFEGYVQQHILTPLGMKSSTLLLKEANPQLLTTPHVLDDAYGVVVSKTFPYNRAHSPSSTLYSNVLDMARWAMANLIAASLRQTHFAGFHIRGDVETRRHGMAAHRNQLVPRKVPRAFDRFAQRRGRRFCQQPRNDTRPIARGGADEQLRPRAASRHHECRVGCGFGLAARPNRHQAVHCQKPFLNHLESGRGSRREAIST